MTNWKCYMRNKRFKTYSKKVSERISTTVSFDLETKTVLIHSDIVNEGGSEQGIYLT